MIGIETFDTKPIDTYGVDIMPLATTNKHRLKAAERLNRIVELRREGQTFAEIGHQVGVSRQRAHRAIVDHLTHLDEETRRHATALRALENERLDLALRKLWPDVERGSLAAVDRLLRIMERRARLYGLDAPQKTALTDPTGDNEYSGGGLASLLMAVDKE